MLQTKHPLKIQGDIQKNTLKKFKNFEKTTRSSWGDLREFHVRKVYNCSQFSILQKKDIISEISKAKGTRGKNKCLHCRYPPCLDWTISSYLYSNFELSVESNSELLWFCFLSFSDWSGRLPLLPQPIRFKTKTNRDMVTAFSRVLGSLLLFTLSSHWLLKYFPVFWLVVVATLGLVLWHSIRTPP